MEGNGQQQFAQEIFACLRPLVAAPTVKDKDLDIFTQDVPFNFAVEQALDRLEDPRVLAKVARFRMLNTHVSVFASSSGTIQNNAQVPQSVQ